MQSWKKTERWISQVKLNNNVGTVKDFPHARTNTHNWRILAVIHIHIPKQAYVSSSVHTQNHWCYMYTLHFQHNSTWIRATRRLAYTQAHAFHDTFQAIFKNEVSKHLVLCYQCSLWYLTPVQWIHTTLQQLPKCRSSRYLGYGSYNSQYKTRPNPR